MYSKSKYIVGEVMGSFGTHLCAVVFPETVGHDDIGRRLFIDGTIRSAGFCHFSEDDVKVYGESVSLRVKSNPAVDTALVGRAMSHPKYIF